MAIYDKIYNVMLEAEKISANMTVGSGNNKYQGVSEAMILNTVKPLFIKHKLIMLPVDIEVAEHESIWEQKYSNSSTTKKRLMTQLKMYFKIIDVETKEEITVCGVGNGADSMDKGSGKAMTYAYKAILQKTFMLFSGDDTDNHHSDDLQDDDKKTDANNTNNKKVDNVTEIKEIEEFTGTVKPSMLEELAKEKNVKLEEILKKYKKETNKDLDDIKYITQAKKKEYYNQLLKLKVDENLKKGA